MTVLNSQGVVSFTKASDLAVQVYLADGEHSGLDSESEHEEGDEKEENKEIQEKIPRKLKEIELCK